MDYKSTLNIFHTDFSMKANLSESEQTIQQSWLDNNIYQKLLEKNKNKVHWIVHDGPPYANGFIHIGHAFNKILKDFVVRIKSFQGYYSPFIPGFDTHGLPIESALNKLGVNVDPNLSPITKRNNCLEFAKQNISFQTKQFARIGLLTDFRKIYVTYSKEFELDQLKIFSQIVKKGLIYRSKKPVYWSWSSLTALAEAEVVYKTVESPSIYVKFPTTVEFKTIPENTNILIWTTTPWTLVSNVAICASSNFTYSLIKVDNDHYLIMSDLLDKLSTLFKWNNYTVINTYTGKDLEYLEYYNHLTNTKSYLILGDHVSGSEGTGLVHTASGFGLDDWVVCQKYGIGVYAPLGVDGKFTNEVKVDEVKGVFYQKANKIIIDLLIKKNLLVHQSYITHNIAHDWRTNKPLIYLATDQWFINIDAIKNDIVKSCENLTTNPSWIKKQLVDVVIKRKEWCISRQRLWGVPIPILFDENNEPILDHQQIDYTIEKLGQLSTNAWFELDAKEFLAPKYQHLKNVTKSQDIMDVWFDSGTSYTILKHNNLSLPAQLYLEGSDQFRGWFNSSLVTSVIVNGICPYENLVTHGFILDEHGMKMSKSKGNVIDPMHTMSVYGADVLRLWVCSVDYTQDVNIGNRTLDQVANNYRKIRNSLFRFSLANLVDFDHQVDHQKQLDVVHQYMLNELNETIKSCIESINRFNYYLVIKNLNTFINKYSSWYLNYVKSDLYCEVNTSVKRRQIQTVLYQTLTKTMMILAPFLPHTCEQVYLHLNIKDKKESVHLEDWDNLITTDSYQVNEKAWVKFFKLKDIVYEQIEKARDSGIVRQSQQADVTVNSSYYDPYFSLDQYRDMLIVANLSFCDDVDTVSVKKTLNPQCERCKNYTQSTFNNDINLCDRCFSAVGFIQNDDLTS